MKLPNFFKYLILIAIVIQILECVSATKQQKTTVPPRRMDHYARVPKRGGGTYRLRERPSILTEPTRKQEKEIIAYTESEQRRMKTMARPLKSINNHPTIRIDNQGTTTDTKRTNTQVQSGKNSYGHLESSSGFLSQNEGTDAAGALIHSVKTRTGVVASSSPFSRSPSPPRDRWPGN
jgi:hypothetical protein